MMKNSKRIGLIGLGCMRFPMTSQLAAAGYSFLICDIHNPVSGGVPKTKSGKFESDA
jgi:UDP-N-acetyl-D-mannosaminuronate dehydrogenase